MEFYLLSNDSEIRKLAMTFRKRVDFGGECWGELVVFVFLSWGKVSYLCKSAQFKPLQRSSGRFSCGIITLSPILLSGHGRGLSGWGRGSIQVGSRGQESHTLPLCLHKDLQSHPKILTGKSFKIDTGFVLVEGISFVWQLIAWFDGQSQGSWNEIIHPGVALSHPPGTPSSPQQEALI